MTRDELIQMHVYACEGTVATPSPAENFGIMNNIQELNVRIIAVYIVVPYFYEGMRITLLVSIIN